MQQPAYYGFPSMNINFDALGTFPSQSSQGSLHSHGADLNSPDVFKQNIQLVQGHVVRVQALARSALAGIEHAYHPGTNPIQTAGDIVALKQALLALVDVLRHTGVGALPLEPPLVPDPRPEDQLVAEATRAVQALYDRQRRIQEGAGVVEGLLSLTVSGDQQPSLGAKR